MNWSLDITLELFVFTCTRTSGAEFSQATGVVLKRRGAAVQMHVFLARGNKSAHHFVLTSHCPNRNTSPFFPLFPPFKMTSHPRKTCIGMPVPRRFKTTPVAWEISAPDDMRTRLYAHVCSKRLLWHSINAVAMLSLCKNCLAIDISVLATTVFFMCIFLFSQFAVLL